MSDIKERLDTLKSLLQNKDFLEGKGLSNEVNIRIFCYDPAEEMAVRCFTDQVETDQNLECNLKIFNLYELFLDACDDMGITEAVSEMEKDDGSDYLLEQVHSAIGEDEFISRMQYDNHQFGRDIIMLTGIGDVYPFMRVHKLLEAMQPYFSDVPIVVMYPGEFDGCHLKLFNKLVPSNYYRAFNIV